MLPKQILDAFKQGQNITNLLREDSDSTQNTEEIIETAYDLQTGSYIRALEDPDSLKRKQAYSSAIASEMLALTAPTSILEPGVGEGTTFAFVLRALATQLEHLHGFDISWSRIACCRQYLQGQGSPSAFLSVASIFHAPYADNSFDIVYTSHTIEPNGGNERPILTELYRIASRYLILLEPGFELAPEEARERMLKHGYCTGLVSHAEDLGMRVLKHALFGNSANPLNPTAITIIEKSPDAPPAVPALACPRYGTPLTDYGESLYSQESLRAYPKIQSIPCLRCEDGIIASVYDRYQQGEQSPPAYPEGRADAPSGSAEA